jgi:hypothetical protein
MKGRPTVSRESSMDCLTFRARIGRGEPLDAGAREHALACEACGAALLDDAALARRLVAASVESAGSSAPGGSDTRISLEATRRLLGRDRGLLGALRLRPTWQRLAALLGLLGAGLSWESIGAAHAAGEIALHVLVFAVACALLLWPLGWPLPRLGRAVAVGVALALPIGFALWAHLRSPSPTPESSPWPCLAYGAVLAASFLGALVALDRRAALGMQQALIAGSIGGVAGNALLHLHCPSDALAHLALGHAPLGVVAALMALTLAFARGQRQLTHRA